MFTLLTRLVKEIDFRLSISKQAQIQLVNSFDGLKPLARRELAASLIPFLKTNTPSRTCCCYWFFELPNGKLELWNEPVAYCQERQRWFSRHESISPDYYIEIQLYKDCLENARSC